MAAQDVQDAAIGDGVLAAVSQHALQFRAKRDAGLNLLQLALRYAVDIRTSAHPRACGRIAMSLAQDHCGGWLVLVSRG